LIQEAASAVGGKPGVPVIFADELDDEVPRGDLLRGAVFRGELGVVWEEDTDNDDPLPGLPPQYRPSFYTPADTDTGAGCELLLVESPESSDDDDEGDLELSRQHPNPKRTV